jgi:hypothetical protein
LVLGKTKAFSSKVSLPQTFGPPLVGKKLPFLKSKDWVSAFVSRQFGFGMSVTVEEDLKQGDEHR